MENKTDTTTSAPLEFRSRCPVACTLDLIGDKWTLVVVRDLFLGKRRYNEFHASPEAIPTNVLADRLKRLEMVGIVRKEFYQENPRRAEYLLTDKGNDLRPVLRAMVDWAMVHIPGVRLPNTDPSPESQSRQPRADENT